MYNDLKQLYENLNLKENNGLVLLKDNWENELKKYNFSFETINQLKIIKPTSLFAFNNVPFILFFDNPKNEKQIHYQVFCFDKTPVIFILKENEIKIYHAFKLIEKNELQNIDIKDDEIKRRFNFWEITSGKTWKWIEELFLKKKNNRIDDYLLENIKYSINTLEDNGLNKKIANKLILRLIFTRYLIDRGVIIGEYIDGNPEEQKKRKKSFINLILNHKNLFLFFEYLKNRFNGNLFEIEENEEIDIKIEHLNMLSILFSGNDLKSGQKVLFDVYDFSIIPIELISGIYEAILSPKQKKKDSAVYTPPYLVDYVLSKTIDPYLQNNSAFNCSVFDPACGSGIFLVQTYKRLIEKEKPNFKYLQQDEVDKKLIELLEKNIYGIDININAINVAIFSFYIALLDYKDPKEINSIKFPPLILLE